MSFSGWGRSGFDVDKNCFVMSCNLIFIWEIDSLNLVIFGELISSRSSWQRILQCYFATMGLHKLVFNQWACMWAHQLRNVFPGKIDKLRVNHETIDNQNVYQLLVLLAKDHNSSRFSFIQSIHFNHHHHLHSSRIWHQHTNKFI